jgi:hypothetical protein
MSKMPRYFTTSEISSHPCVCDDNYSEELKILREITEDFKRLIEHYPEGVFPATVSLTLSFEANASTTDKIVLTLEGTMMYIYVKMFKERFPSKPFTELQRQRINAIWEGIGHPENIIPS